MTEHTPTPWWNESRVLHARIGEGPAASHPAQCPSGGLGIFATEAEWEQAEADADFIELACNSHDEMTAALEAVLGYLPANNPSLHAFWRAWLPKADAALTKAKKAP